MKADDAAFPRPCFAGSDGSFSDEQRGMALRDWFAGQALVGLLDGEEPTWPWSSDDHAQALARRAYQIADAMLKRRGRSR